MVTYVTDGISNPMAQAKAAVGDRNVMVMARTRRNGSTRQRVWTDFHRAETRSSENCDQRQAEKLVFDENFFVEQVLL